MVAKILSAIAPPEKIVEYDERIIKCFVAGAIDTMKFYFTDLQVNSGTPSLREPDALRNCYASAVISLKTSDFGGTMSLGLPVTFIKQWVMRIFEDPDFKINNEVIGSVTEELCNQVQGIVTSNLEKLGIRTDQLSTSILTIGKAHAIRHEISTRAIVIPINVGETGGIELEFCSSKSLAVKASANT